MENIAGFMKRHPLSSFFVLAYSDWALVVVLYTYLRTTGTPARVDQAGAVALLILFLAQGFASAAGIVTTLIIGGREGMKELLGRLKQWRAGINWYAAAILTTSVAATAVLVALAVTISPHFLPALLKGQNVLAAIPFVIFFGLMAGVLEEFGWTGFALPRLLARYPAFRAALLLGTPRGWRLYPHAGNDGKALHLIDAESQDEIFKHLEHFHDIYEHSEIVEIMDVD